jgi:hypothetical protein
MQQIESQRTSGAWRFLGVALAPIIVMSACLLFTGWRNHGANQLNTSVAFLLAIAAGECFVLTLPIRWSYRIICLFIYVPVAWALLFFYALFFIFVVFRGHLG